MVWKVRRGFKLSEDHKNKLRLAKLGKKGQETNRWVGDKVKDSGLHKWLRKHFPPPKECEFCKQIKPLQLANITGIYKRDIKNFKYLCSKCHVYLDGTVDNLKSRHTHTNRAND